MANPFIYAITSENKLLWYRHNGINDGSFNWKGPQQVGTGWNFKHVFSGGDGIIYAIEREVAAGITLNGKSVPASGGRLLWFRHVGQADGTFKWEGPKTVGTGWGSFKDVFYGGDGIIYAIKPIIEEQVHIVGKTTPRSGGELLWAKHLGRMDGTFRWQDFKIVGTGWSNFERVFYGGEGVIYAIEKFNEARILITGQHIPASGGGLMWAKHLGRDNGEFKWMDFRKVGHMWSGMKQVFSAGNGILYLIDPVIEATISINGRHTPSSGGNLRWYRHLGFQNGTSNWEPPRQVGTGWGFFQEVFSGGGGLLPAPVSNKRFCAFIDPPSGIGIHTNSYTLKNKRRKLTLTWTITATLPNVNIQQVVNRAFAVWKAAAPALNFIFIPSSITNPGAPSNPSVDISIGTQAFAPNTSIGSTTSDGSSIVFDTNTQWVAANPITPTTTSLLAVAIHEIGHAIGLLHNTTDNSIMNPINGNIEVPTADDINGIKALYGWEGQRSIPNRGSDSGPALCACGGILAMAWKGIKGDTSIFYSTSTDGINWTPQQVVQGVGTSDSPTLAWDGARLWMAWTGIPGDSGLYYGTTNNPASWPSNPGINIANVGSSNAPFLTMAPGPTLAWKGISGDSGIFTSSFNAGTSSWSPQQQLGGAGTSDRPVIISDVNLQKLMIWKGIDGDSNIFDSTLSGIFWQPQQLLAWIVPGNNNSGTIDVRLPGTSCGPGVATDGVRVFTAWRGAGADSGIWFSQRAADVVGGINIVEWSSQGNIPDVGTSHRPAVAFFSGRIYVAWKGVGNDTTIWMTRL